MLNYKAFEKEISKYKHQITNKSQITISNFRNMFEISNFGYWNLFGFWYLGFGIFGYEIIYK
jgi:hypothetical protein